MVIALWTSLTLSILLWLSDCAMRTCAASRWPSSAAICNKVLLPCSHTGGLSQTHGVYCQNDNTTPRYRCISSISKSNLFGSFLVMELPIFTKKVVVAGKKLQCGAAVHHICCSFRKQRVSECAHTHTQKIICSCLSPPNEKQLLSTMVNLSTDEVLDLIAGSTILH